MLSKRSKRITDAKLQNKDQISFLFASYDPQFLLNQQEFQEIHATDKSYFRLCSCISKRSCSQSSKSTQFSKICLFTMFLKLNLLNGQSTLLR